MHDLEFLRAAIVRESGGRPIWILSETKFRVHFLSQTFPQSPAFFGTLGDGFWKFLSLVDRNSAGQRRLSPDRATSELLSLVSASSKEFPILFAEIFGGEIANVAPSFRQSSSSVRRFLDLVRLNERSESILRRLLDDHGNTRFGRERLEELFLLLEKYRQFQTEVGRFDAPGVLERLSEVLQLGSKLAPDRRRIPQEVILDQPTELFPIERRMLLEISKLVPVRVALDQKYLYANESLRLDEFSQQLPPSRKSSASALYFANFELAEIAEITSLHPERESVISKIFDGNRIVADEPLEKVAIWESTEIRDEVERLSNAVTHSIGQGTLFARDLHVVTTDLESYGELLEESFCARGLTVWLPNGCRLGETAPGSLLQVLCEWLLRPAISTLAALTQHPLYRSRQRSGDAAGLKVYSAVLDSCEKFAGVSEILSNRSWHEAASVVAPNYSRLFRILGYLGLEPDVLGDSNWAEPVIYFFSDALSRASRQSPERLRQTVAEMLSVLAAIQLADIQAAEISSLQTAESCRSAVTLMQKKFRASRKRLREAAGGIFGARSDLEISIRALRKVRTVLKNAAAAAEIAIAVGNTRPPFMLLAEEIEQEILAQRVALARAENSIAVSEFLDVRAMHTPVVCILGLTSGRFPLNSEALSGAEIDRISEELVSAAGQSPVYESYALFSHLLMTTDELVISFSRQGSSGEYEPAQILEQLAALIGNPLEQVNFEKLIEPLEVSRVFPPADAETSTKSIKLIERRGSLELTEFDGVLGQSALAAVAESSARPRGVSTLETLVDCAHRFFFSSILEIEEPANDFHSLIYIEVGTITHDALDLFFKQPDADQLLRNNFGLACRRMLEIADGVWKKSILSALQHPFAAAQRGRIVGGLDQAGDDGRRGLLKGALAFHRDSTPADAVRTEFYFGAKSPESPALRVGSGATALLVSGKIDRLEFVRDENGNLILDSIWDYKTGSIKKASDARAGRSLQLALYALAARQNIAPNLFPRRGGMIDLSKPNQRRPDSRAPIFVEHFGTTSDAQALVSTTEAQLFEVQSSLNQGRFTQRLETRECRFCEFNRICYRDAALLEKKLSLEKPALIPSQNELRVRKFFIPEPSRKAVRLSPEQISACDVTRSIALSAGAGSGKTAVITSRVLKLLIDGAPLESIVAITFTEKSAAEIYLRIQRLISGAVESEEFDGEKLDATAIQRLLAARADLPRAAIGTIHLLAGRILSMDPQLGGSADARRIVQGGESLALVAQARREIFADKSYRGQILELLGGGIAFAALANETEKLVRNRRQREQLVEIYRADARHALHQKLAQLFRTRETEFLADLSHQLADWAAQTDDWLQNSPVGKGLEEEQGQKFRELISGALALSKLTGSPSAEAAKCLPDFGKLQEFAIANQKFQKRVGKSTNPINFWIKLRDKVLNEFQAELTTYALGPAQEFKGIEIAASILNLADAVAQRYAALKATESIFDFDDLIFSAHKILCGEVSPNLSARQARLKQRVQEIYRHVLVDEFQDTDPLQWEMVKALVPSVFAGQSPDIILRTAFLVGDAQQAIYGFRGGDVRVFEAAKGELTSVHGADLALHDNYRAHPELVAFINAFFERLFSVDFDEGGTKRVQTAVRSLEMNARRAESSEQKPAARVRMLVDNRHSDEEIEDAQGPSSEAERVADFIGQVLQNLSNPESEYSSLNFYPGKKIAVLGRRSNDLQKIARELESRRIPFSLTHSAGFYDREEIVQIENLLRVLHDETDTIALVGLLRSSLFGYSDEELLLIFRRLDASWLPFYSAERAQDVDAESIRMRLSGWRTAAALQKPSRLLTSVLSECNLAQAYFAAGRAEVFRNIERLIDSLREAERRSPEGGSLDFAVRWFEQQRTEQSSAPNANSSNHPVVLSTIHSAKGLEFPMVILPYLSPREHTERDFLVGEVSFGKSGSLLLLGAKTENEANDFKRERTLIQKMIAENSRELDCAEERRLFYVACTRAREHLVLSLTMPKNFTGRQTDYSGYSELEKRDKCFNSQRPADWLRLLLEPDSLEHPTRWNVLGDPSLAVPVI